MRSQRHLQGGAWSFAASFTGGIRHYVYIRTRTTLRPPGMEESRACSSPQWGGRGINRAKPGLCRESPPTGEMRMPKVLPVLEPEKYPKKFFPKSFPLALLLAFLSVKVDT